MMQVLTIVKDNLGNVGKIPLVQGESRTINVFFFNIDGTPFVYTGTPSEIVAKVFSNINQASIQKRYSLSKVSLLSVSGTQTGIIGVQFTLLTTETPLMAANNSGLGLSLIFTDSATPANVFELDLPDVFSVSVPLIQT